MEREIFTSDNIDFEFTEQGIESLLACKESEKIISYANNLCRKNFRGSVWIRGLIEFSNYCCRNCLYCGLRRDNKNIKRYRMSSDDILKTAETIIKEGIETVVLQSGDDLYYSRYEISDIIKKIKKINPKQALTLSVGERDLDDYKYFFDAGADRFLMKHETFSENLYNKIHPGQSFKARIKTIELLKKIGFQTGIGNIIGLPYQTLKDLAKDIMFYYDFQPDMIGSGPFIPQGDTIFKDFKSPSCELVLKCYALARIAVKSAQIPVSTASLTLGQEKFQISALKSGCNVVMAGFTPEHIRLNYKIYDNRFKQSLSGIRDTIEKAGFTPDCTRGDSLNLFSSARF
ncbi:MAG: [FeFe] hydrogenase H-cluster radical SAM maturase HydE [Candidatus Omnitrophica bacterium]|nr:[FeFe] hydrogenase H-cluster radical SAM maturase HydE [Candidatus Omnitrophota bacterium]